MHRRIVLGLAAIAAIVVSSPAAAQQPGLNGSFMLDGANSNNAVGAINAAVARLPLAERQAARARLRRATTPPARIQIALAGGQATLMLGDKPLLTIRTDGTPVQWLQADGSALTASATLADGALTLVLASSHEKQRLVYRPQVGGSLDVETSLSGPRLAAPIRYTSRYDRQR